MVFLIGCMCCKIDSHMLNHHFDWPNLLNFFHKDGLITTNIHVELLQCQILCEVSVTPNESEDRNCSSSKKRYEQFLKANILGDLNSFPEFTENSLSNDAPCHRDKHSPENLNLK